MIRIGTRTAAALIVLVTLSTPSFSQSLSQYDIEQQRLNDIRQRTTDSGLNTINHPLDRTSMDDGYALHARERQLQGIAPQHSGTAATDTWAKARHPPRACRRAASLVRLILSHSAPV